MARGRILFQGHHRLCVEGPGFETLWTRYKIMYMYCQWLDNMGAQTEHAKTVNYCKRIILFSVFGGKWLPLI